MNKKKLFQIAIFGLCIILIARYFLNHREEMVALPEITLTTILAIALLYTAAFFLISRKMYLILRKAGIDTLAPLQWFKIYAISRFVNTHISQGGNIYRVLVLKRKFQFPYTKTIGMTAVFTWLETIFMLIIAIISIGLTRATLILFNTSAVAILLTSLIAILIIPFIAKRMTRSIALKNTFIAWINEKASIILDNFVECSTDKMFLMRQLILTIAGFIILILINDLAFKAINIHLSIAELIIFIVMLTFSGLFTITPGNIGVTEVMYGYLSQAVGHSFGEGIIACGLLRIIAYFTTALLTLTFINTLSFKKIFKEYET